MLEGVCGSGGGGAKYYSASPEKQLLSVHATPLPISLGAAWPVPKGEAGAGPAEGFGSWGWVWSKDYHCPAWLRLAPELIDTRVPPSCSQEGCKVLIVILASLAHLSSKAPVITELKWGRGGEVGTRTLAETVAAAALQPY